MTVFFQQTSNFSYQISTPNSLKIYCSTLLTVFPNEMTYFKSHHNHCNLTHSSITQNRQSYSILRTTQQANFRLQILFRSTCLKCYILLLYFSGSQQSNELKDALDAEMEKTKEMEASMKKLDEEMKRSDELLSQMIPKSVADKVKSGLNPVETCEVRDLW